MGITDYSELRTSTVYYIGWPPACIEQKLKTWKGGITWVRNWLIPDWACNAGLLSSLKPLSALVINRPDESDPWNNLSPWPIDRCSRNIHADSQRNSQCKQLKLCGSAKHMWPCHNFRLTRQCCHNRKTSCIGLDCNIAVLSTDNTTAV